MATAPGSSRGEGEHANIAVRFAKSARFGRLVRTYWEVHGHFPHTRERVLPTADLFVLVNLGAPHILIAAGTETVYADAWVSGIQRSALVTGSLGATDIWGAKLNPRGAQLAFGSAAAVAGKVADFTELLGTRGTALAGRLRDASSFEQRCAIFDAHLASALLSGRERWSPAVAWAFDRLGTDQTARIADLACEIGWSRKHLHAQFVGHFGQSPKTLARLARFERALRLLEDDSARLAAIAADAGYYDQSQFNREFRSLAGITPSAYLHSRVAGADYGFVDADDR